MHSKMSGSKELQRTCLVLRQSRILGDRHDVSMPYMVTNLSDEFECSPISLAIKEIFSLRSFIRDFVVFAHHLRH